MLLFKYLDLKLNVKCRRKDLEIGVALERKRRRNRISFCLLRIKIKSNKLRLKDIIHLQGSGIVDLFLQQLSRQLITWINGKNVLPWYLLTPHHYQVQVFLEKQRISISSSKVHKIESFLHPNSQKKIFIVIPTIILKGSLTIANTIQKKNN